MKNTLRILSLILAVCCLTALLPSCGKEKTAKLTNVFRELPFETPEEYFGPNSSVGSCYASGDGFYVMIYNWDDKTGASTQTLLPFNAEGKLGEPISFTSNENGNENIVSLCTGSDGTVYIMIEKYSYSETDWSQTYELRKFKDGKSETIPLDKINELVETEGFYVNYFAAAKDGTLVLGSWNGVRAMSPDGKTLREMELEGDNTDVEGMICIDGDVYVRTWAYNELEQKSTTAFAKIDLETMELEKPIPFNSANMYSMFTGPGFDFYTRDSNCVYGCSLDGTTTEVVNFINSDLDTNRMNNIVMLSADRFAAVGYDQMTGTQSISMYERVPDDQIVEKVVIKLACVYLDYNLRQQIVAYNKSNDKYRITVEDYSIYNTENDYNAGQTKLTNDIIAGKMPDILAINSEFPYESYVAQGIFADLNKLMDADESFDRADYLNNIFEAMEINGKLYSIMPSVEIETFAAKRSVLGGRTRWTVDEFMEFAKANPDKQVFDYEFNRDYFLRMLLTFSRDSFIDPATGKCSFDSPEFRRLLEFAKSLPEDEFWSNVSYEDDSFWQEYNDRFRDDRVVLSMAYIYDLADSYRNMFMGTFFEEFDFIGFPCDEGNGAIILANGGEYAIASRSKHKEAAWDFLKSLISEKAQMPYWQSYEWGGYWNYPVYSIPMNRKVLDKMVEIAMGKDEHAEETRNGGMIVYAETAVASSAINVVEDYAVEEIAPEPDAAEPVETAAAAAKKVAAAPAVPVAAEVTAAPAIAVETPEITLDEPVVIEEPVVIDKPVVIDEPVIGMNWNTPLTEEQIDQVLDVIMNAKQIMRYDEELFGIVSEEAGAYFADQKTLDQTVALIQSRVSLYINENR